jgi:hypothetical protein
MSTIRRKRPTPQQQTDMRKITAYGEVSGTGLMINELEDGATVTAVLPEQHPAHPQLVINAENLMKLTRQLADWFGHIVIHPTEWREKLAAAIEQVMVEHESRCLDDDIDRRVVIDALVAALHPRFVPAR